MKVGRCVALGFGAKSIKVKGYPPFLNKGVHDEMDADNILRDFMTAWNENQVGPNSVKVFPDVSEGIILGFKFRFNGARYPIDHATFRGLSARVYANSKNQLRVKSGFGDFLAGSLELEVLETHQRFAPLIIKGTLEFLLQEVFPDLRSQRNQKLSPWQAFRVSIFKGIYRLLSKLLP